MESETNVQLQYTIKEVAVLNERVTEIEQFHITRYNKLDTELQEHLMDLDGSNASTEKQGSVDQSTQTQQWENHDKEFVKKNQELSSECDTLKHHRVLLEQERQELVDQTKELYERLSETESLLEETMMASHQQQQNWKNTTMATTTIHDDKAGVIAVLEYRLTEQKRMYEDRLQTIHSILGLKFTTAVQTQVEEIHSKASIAIKVMPESFRVPLILYPVVKTV